MGALCMPTMTTTTTTSSTGSGGFKTGMSSMGMTGGMYESPKTGYNVEEIVAEKKAAKWRSKGSILLSVAMVQTTTRMGLTTMNYYSPSHIESQISSDTWLAGLVAKHRLDLNKFITEVNVEIGQFAPWSAIMADPFAKVLIIEGYVQRLESLCFRWNQGVFWRAGCEASVSEKIGNSMATVTGIVFRLLTKREREEKAELFLSSSVMGSGLAASSTAEGTGKVVTGVAATEEAPPGY